VELSDLIVSDPGVMSGMPCFRGTRVPVSVLFENLAAGMSVEEILETWPTLDGADVLAVVELAGQEAEPRAAKIAGWVPGFSSTRVDRTTR
jgi:uncharacterized protein (DUF433 family)